MLVFHGMTLRVGMEHVAQSVGPSFFNFDFSTACIYVQINGKLNPFVSVKFKLFHFFTQLTI